MAELAAKIRAKFRRRHSAIPGIPSLLSRTSVRSSGSHGSHGSSLFRPTSLTHSFSTHDADADADFDGEAKSRVGSSRGSMLDPADQSGEADGALAHLAGGPQAGDVHGEPAVVAHTGAETQAQEAARNGRHHGQRGPTDTDAPASQAGRASQASARPALQAHSGLAAGVSSTNGNLEAPPASPAPAPAPASAPATAPGCPTAPAQAPALTATPAAAVAPGAPATPLATSSPSTSTSTSASTIPAASSNMSGKDRQPLALRKLSIVDEQPSPDNLDAKDPSDEHHDRDRDRDRHHLDADQHDHHHDHHHDSAIPVATAAPPPAATPLSLPKRDDAKLRAAAPLTPKLGPPTPSRPRHIHLPPASFGGPNPNISPGAIYSAALTNTAPTSPLRQSTLAPLARPAPVRRQSLLSNRQSTLIHTLLGRSGSQPEDPNVLTSDQLLPIDANMVTRKIWVKRPGASATMITISEDDLVDDVREMVLRKYANSLGRHFDAPDLSLRIRPSANQQERILGPEEPMSRTLDAYFPSGQNIDDALVIDVPLRRTPRASPRVGPSHAPHIQYYVEDPRPPETANDYFGPGALSALPVTVTAPSAGSGHSHAISVLSTGQVPQIPSPGGRRARDYRERPERPRLGRQHTSSPTLINLASGATHQGSIAAAAIAQHADVSQVAPQPAAVATPPPAEPVSAVPQAIVTPPARVASPRPKKIKKKTDHPMLPKGMLNGSVPPINVLIVEDNIINLKLLEAFVKRLKVRWSTAMNGRDAVTKWRNGGFHLVLMDIQLPIMSGLDATREIRRLERVNSIGVFSSAASSAPEEVKGEPDEKDKLENKDLFKSPVIIVALTASSLQSDRHEALAAGCNDFLTKPVNFVWLERKVMEWGCMQALIDFDGWRKWKDFSSQQVDDRAKAAAALKAKSKKNRSSLTQAVTAVA